MAKSKADGTIAARVDLDGVVWADITGDGTQVGYENRQTSGVIGVAGKGDRSVLVAHISPGEWTLRLLDDDDRVIDSDSITI